MTATFFSDFYTKSPVTLMISLAVLLFSAASLLRERLFFAFILHPFSVIRNRQYYRILTADLVNADWVHLALNEFMLYVFCSDLEETLRHGSSSGSWQFLLIYFGSLAAASAIVIVRHRNDFNYSTTGTSGSIMGCMFGFMMLDPNYIVYKLSSGGGVKNIYGGLMYIIMLIIYQKRKDSGYVNHEYHFYGALGGLLVTSLLHPEILRGIVR